jgi:steroid delta-isomerase-like uncharacterized protein
MAPANIQQLLTAYVSAWSSEGDVDPLLSFLADTGFTYTAVPLGLTITGKTNMIPFYTATLSAFRNINAHVDSLTIQNTSDRDTTKVLMQWTFSGFHVGNFLGFPPTHKVITFPLTANTVDVKNGKIQSATDEWDQDALIAQLSGDVA